ncbi:hypothetical protein HaLaN_26689 [Haematococcus lacustris]|uniref:Uncharacterized protein n=1 Tax=Haematococcus lacustris TaxID=44745 RepID=A0A6A0A6V7_HAELA|nr:hypothetical protein HaLaN_26689 [Haematococcus lacustris]
MMHRPTKLIQHVMHRHGRCLCLSHSLVCSTVYYSVPARDAKQQDDFRIQIPVRSCQSSKFSQPRLALAGGGWQPHHPPAPARQSTEPQLGHHSGHEAVQRSQAEHRKDVGSVYDEGVQRDAEDRRDGVDGEHHV